MSKFQVKAQDSRDEVLSQLALALRCSPSFIHSDPKWFHDLQPAENRASSQREKTYCGSETCSCSIHMLPNCVYTQYLRCISVRNQFIKPVSCPAIQIKNPVCFIQAIPIYSLLLIEKRSSLFILSIYSLQLGQHCLLQSILINIHGISCPDFLLFLQRSHSAVPPNIH